MSATTNCVHGIKFVDCPECVLERNRRWNRESYQRCREKRLADSKGYRQNNWEKAKKATSEANKRRYKGLKEKAFEVFGRVCVCCGEDNTIFLTLDHVNNDGAEHRKVIGKGAFGIYGWLERNGWPTEGLQMLCWNCNMGKRINGGVCPHQAEDLHKAV